MSDRTTVLSQDEKEGKIISYKMGAQKIPKGTLVSLRTDGYAYRARNGTATDIFIGVAAETIDNSGGAAGDLSIRVLKTGTFVFDKGTAVIADLIAPMYASDNETLTATSTNAQLVGYPVELVSSSRLRIRIDLAAK